MSEAARQGLVILSHPGWASCDPKGGKVTVRGAVSVEAELNDALPRRGPLAKKWGWPLDTVKDGEQIVPWSVPKARSPASDTHVRLLTPRRMS